MKTSILTLLLGLSSTIVLLAQESKPFSIKGKIDSLANGKVIFQYQLGDSLVKDSVQAQNGKFHFKGRVPSTIYIAARFNDQYFLPVIVSPKEKIRINGHLGNLKAAKIRGSKEQPVWEAWSKDWNAITKQAGVLYKLSDSIGENGDRSAVEAGFKALDQQTEAAVHHLATAHPNSPLAAFIILDRYVSYPNPAKAAKFHALLGADAKASYYGKELEKAIAESQKTAVGVMAEDFTQPDTEGNPMKLSSLHGKYVLVDFWASWCVPCRKENPNVVAAYKKYHDKGFEILGVSLDNNKEAWMKAIAADDLTWYHVSDLKGWKNEAAQQYGVKSVPTNVLIDPSGKIIAKDLRGEALEELLKTLF
ncbi:TlpA disulfide reductase family protein [Parapedobacter tibetensis]|uniref:TlpA disulfide reductase family protein n=1 Tax=Parapedobacter tibetensis TaxID=2972951 RepID=UPI00214D8381|nr:TlpA disulfide reductase family protein [Parapedobacter tibetensis]